MNIILQKTQIGVGESALLLKYAHYFSFKHGKKFDKSHICYTKKQFIDKVKTSHNSIIVFDEIMI